MRQAFALSLAIVVASAATVFAGQVVRDSSGAANPAGIQVSQLEQSQPRQLPDFGTTALELKVPTCADVAGGVGTLSNQVGTLSNQVGSLQQQLTAIEQKLDASRQEQLGQYKRAAWRVKRGCELIYTRSYKAGDNPSSGTGGGFKPGEWCDLGSYPYWQSIE